MEKQVVQLDYKVGDIVNILYNNTKAVVLGFEENKLFDSVYCVKVMCVGSLKPTYILSDRVRKL